jgi:hypothetical protein
MWGQTERSPIFHPMETVNVPPIPTLPVATFQKSWIAKSALDIAQ